MNKTRLYKVLYIVFLVFFSGCQFTSQKKQNNLISDYNNNIQDRQIGPLFRKQLISNLLTCSDSNMIKYDFCDQKKMKKKASIILSGLYLAPENPYSLWLPEDKMSEVVGAWQFLNYIIDSGLSSQKNLANLYFYYECWIQQSQNENYGIYSTVCKNQFLRLMNQIINGCKTNFLVEFSPKGNNEINSSGLALDSVAQSVIYSFLRLHNSQEAKNKFLIVGEKNHAIKVANFMNVQGAIEKNRLKVVVSDKMDEGFVGLFLDNDSTRYCFINSHKKSISDEKNVSNEIKSNIYNYTDHNKIENENNNEINEKEKIDENKVEIKNNDSLEKIEEKKIIEENNEKNESLNNEKNNRTVERIK